MFYKSASPRSSHPDKTSLLPLPSVLNLHFKPNISQLIDFMINLQKLRTVTSLNKQVNYFLATEVLSFHMQDIVCFLYITPAEKKSFTVGPLLFPMLSFLRIDNFAVSMQTSWWQLLSKTFLLQIHLYNIPFDQCSINLNFR